MSSNKMSETEIKLAEKKLHDMTIEEQKDMYGNEDTMNKYFVNLAGRIRNTVQGGYLLPKEADKSGKA